MLDCGRADWRTRNDDGAVCASAALLGTVAREPERMTTLEARGLGDGKTERKNALAAVTRELKAALRESLIVDGGLYSVLLGEKFRARGKIGNCLRREKRRGGRLGGRSGLLGSLRRIVAEHSERKLLLDLIYAEFGRLLGVHLEIRRAGRDNLEKRVALLFALNLEDLADRLLRLHDAARIGDRNARDVDGGLKLIENLADVKRITGKRCVAPERRSRRRLAGERRRRHLAARHPVKRIVDENASKILAAARRLKGVIKTDRAEVAVALIGDRHRVGTRTACAGRRRARTAVGRRNMGGVPIIVRKDAASYGIDENRIVLKTHFGARLGDELVDYAVAAAGAVVGKAHVLAASGELGVHALLFNRSHITSSPSRLQRPRRPIRLRRPCGLPSLRPRPPLRAPPSRG